MSWGVATQNGVSVSLASIVSLSCNATEFSPASLFTSGVAGAWYDPSDTSTLFQDSAGTTPVTAVEQPVGLMLDKSQGLVLGSELNDGLDVLANWTVFGTNTIAADGDAVKVTYVTNAFGAYSLFQAAKGLSTNLTVGQWYKVTGQAKVNTGSANVVINTSTTWTSSAITSTSYVDFAIYFLCDNATTNYIAFSNLQTGEEIWIRGVSVKSLAGNHALQATAASRPVLRARYNQLTYSEQFDNAAWVKTNVTVTANSVVAPDGTTTADTFTPSAANIDHWFWGSSGGADITGTVTVSVCVKPNGYTKVQFGVYRSGASRWAAQLFNLATDAITTKYEASGATVTTSSITDLGNGWKRLTLTASSALGVASIIFSPLSDAASTASLAPSYLGDGTSGIYIWGADLRTGSSAGTYQRIAAATDYATAGFLPYLYFVTDDSFGTNSIDFSATDKMSVCAGVTKLSDAADAMLVELSANSGANNGSFYITAPEITNSLRYAIFSRGAAPSNINQRASTTSATYNAPSTVVLTGIFNISGDSNNLRLNGASIDTATGDQGAGNYGNYPLYIGRRNNATIPFNGNIYQLIVCGKTLSASELASTEAYVATKTGVVI